MKEWKWRIHWIDQKTYEVGATDFRFSAYTAAEDQRDRLSRRDSSGRIYWFQPEITDVPDPKPVEQVIKVKIEPSDDLVAKITDLVGKEITELRKEFDAKIAGIKPDPQLYRVWRQHKDFPGERIRSHFVGSFESASDEVSRSKAMYVNLVHWIVPEVAE